MTHDKILIIAGEASGDRHAADLVAALKNKIPNTEFIGVGGDQLQREGVKLLFHISQLAILGFVEIIKHIPLIRKVFKQIKKEASKGIDAVILVDYPGFNLRLAKTLKKQGIPVIYYICPQMWAWGENRIKKFKKIVDLPLVIFKFEESFFKKHGLNAYFVGHPLVDQLPKDSNNFKFLEKYVIPKDKEIVGLFPGSREIEVKRILPLMVDSIKELQKQREIIPVIAQASHLDKNLYDKYIQNSKNFILIKSDIYQLMQASHVALVASGTATLELGYLQTPSIVLYAVSPLTYWIGRSLVKIKNIALANIVMGKTVFPEFIQWKANTKNILNALNKLFTDEAYYQDVKSELNVIKKILGEPGATDRAATHVINFITTKSLQTSI
jgi:lipid-A-disaccharide synthase